MRKTSQDGGDAASIMSGTENEIKKPAIAVVKNKRNSVKRKVQTLNHESDDAVSEPLLQKDKEKPQSVTQSAKFSMLKSKSDAVQEGDSDKDKLLPDNKTKVSGLEDESLAASTKENKLCKTQPNTTVTLHNHMNTNVFSNINTKFITTTKSQILVEIDGCKQVDYNPSPLIFTTAKIHTDSKARQMEPVQVTTVPILSTTEVAKTGKVSSSVGIVQPMPGTSNTKLPVEPQKNNLNASSPLTAGMNSKYNISKTTTENKTPNTLVTTASISNSLLKDPTKPTAVFGDANVSKTVENKFLDKLPESKDSNKVGDPIKNDCLSKSYQSPLPHYKEVNTVSTTPLPVNFNITGPSRSSKTEDIKSNKATVANKDTLKHEEVKIDNNANTNTATVQQPIKSSVFGTKKSPTDSKYYSDNVSKINVIKDTVNSTSNKQLPRQKNAIVEEPGDIISKSKPSNSERSSCSNNSKYSKDIEPIAKPMTQPKMSEQGTSDISIKTLPNLRANNTIDIMTTKITATCIASKPTSNLSSINKSIVADSLQCKATTASVSTTTIPTSTNIQLIDMKTKGSIMSSTKSTSMNSNLQPISSMLPSVTTSKGDNKLAMDSTTKTVDAGAAVRPSIPSKLSSAYLVKPASIDAPLLSTQNVSTTPSIGLNSSSISSKLSTVTSSSMSSTSTCSTAKPVTTIPADKSSATSKNNGPKSNEMNKDTKGLKT